MSSKLQLDVCDHNQWWHHLVNAYEVVAGMALFAGKTVRVLQLAAKSLGVAGVTFTRCMPFLR